jgi:hypothetical protein
MLLADNLLQKQPAPPGGWLPDRGAESLRTGVAAEIGSPGAAFGEDLRDRSLDRRGG